MTGFDILKARKQANVSQTPLAKRLGLTNRCTLTDIEDGTVRVTKAWIEKAIAAVREIADESKQAVA